MNHTGINPICTAVSSYGMSGKVFHAPLLDCHPGFHMKKIVERSYKGSKERYPEIDVVRSFDELLEDKKIELIIVNTPDVTHFELCKRALEAGKHVVVEKPFAVTSTEAETLISLSKERNRVLSVFQNRRWDSDFLTVKKVLEDNMLGKLVSFESHFDRYRNFIVQNTWKEQRETGAEILYNLGAHMIDQMYCLFGMPESVYANIGVQRSEGEIDDFYNLIFGYKDIYVNLKASYLVREQGPRYILHGTEGSFLKWGLDPQEDALASGKSPCQQGWGVESSKYWGKLNTSINGIHFTGRLESMPGNYSMFYDNIYQTIRNGQTLEVLPEQSLNVIRIIEGAIKSNDTSSLVKFAT